MYIKQVIVQGFKSYRDRTLLEPFDPRHNVIVGKNGSGKSNLFLAIQFVLSGEYARLKPDQRQLIFHEGLGTAAPAASIEIIFDNTDRRLPIPENEVRLRRVVGSKKDNYFINKDVVTQHDLRTMLECAGFSKFQPYYVVKQGEIHQIATATDSQRLELLHEVARTTVYDEKRQQSENLLHEIDDMQKKSSECFLDLDERLKALEREKEELKNYQKLDQQRRCLEYTIYQRELTEDRKKLSDLDEIHSKILIEQRTPKRIAQEMEGKVLTATERWKIVKNTVETTLQEQAMQNTELEQLIQRSTELSLIIDDLKNELKNNEKEKKKAKVELEDLQQKINDELQKLETINPKYDKLLREEEELSREMMLKGHQREQLYLKQGRSAQFNSKETRDDWIQDQLNQLTKQIEDKQAHCSEIREDLANDCERRKILENEIEQLKSVMEAEKTSLDRHNRQRYEIMEQVEQAQSALKELYRNENTLQGNLSSEKENLIQSEHRLRLSVGKEILNGGESVRKIIESFRENPETSSQADRYCGRVIDNFSCGPEAYTAVEIIAGKRLFNHIVETDKFGTKILKEINRRSFPGEVNFMPLNRLNVREINYPDSEHAVPMITKLDYDAKYDKVMRFIFGRTLICRSFDIAIKFARESGLDCVTLEGELVSSKGVLAGGYYNKNRTLLGAHKTQTEIAGKIDDLENRLATTKDKINTIVQALNSDNSKIQQTEQLSNNSKNNIDKMVADMRSIKNELGIINKNRIPKEKSLVQCVTNLDALKATKDGLERELDQDLTSQLSPTEHDLLENLNEEIMGLTKRMKIAFENRLELEKRKNELENVLENNLTRRKDELTKMIQNDCGPDQKHRLKSYQTQLAQILERQDFMINKIKEQGKKVTAALHMMNLEKEGLEKWKQLQKDAQEQMEESAKELLKLVNKKFLYEQKIVRTTENIAELGPLTAPEAYEKFSTMTRKNLFDELSRTNKRLKRKSDVNQKAVDQFESLRDQKGKLMKKHERLNRGCEDIRNIMLTLEQRKFEAIRFTFVQVSKYFTEIFERLASPGHAKLVMKTASEENEEDEEMRAEDVENLTGVAIKVSFTGRSDETSEINQLSGGQKSLVALALIFAFQKCDPAPFYLFDEIDQTLDDKHREAVASMIHELSSNAQFITTTFKPELLRHANKFYSVNFGNKISHVRCVTQEEAAEFVEGTEIIQNGGI